MSPRRRRSSPPSAGTDALALTLDGQPDRVIATATDGDDAVAVSGANGAVTVTGLAARLGITHAEATDSLAVNTLAGHDTVDASGLAANTIQLITD